MAQKRRSRGGAARKANTRTSRRAPRKPDALRLLKQDHQRVKELFERYERTRGAANKERLAETICAELRLHAQLEEEIFYPAAGAAIDAEDLMNEAEVEHASAKDLIGQIETSSPSNSRYDALVTVLREYVLHHVKEEEGEMFKKVRASGLDLAALGEQMAERKRELSGGPTRGRISGALSSLLGSTSRT